MKLILLNESEPSKKGEKIVYSHTWAYIIEKAHYIIAGIYRRRSIELKRLAIVKIDNYIAYWCALGYHMRKMTRE